MPPRFPDISAVILDGGKATRLGGAHKAFLAVGGRPLAERSVEVLRELFADLVAATSRPEAWAVLGVRAVADPVADAGPLAGLAAGLGACRTPRAFVVAGDMPRLSASVIAALCERAGGTGPGEQRVVLPVVDGRPEPLHALYPVCLAGPALEALARGTRKLTRFLEESAVPVDRVPLEELAHVPGARASFRNINTPEDLAEHCPGRDGLTD